MDNVRKCSPSNNEVQTILKQPKQETQWIFYYFKCVYKCVIFLIYL